MSCYDITLEDIAALNASIARVSALEAHRVRGDDDPANILPIWEDSSGMPYVYDRGEFRHLIVHWPVFSLDVIVGPRPPLQAPPPQDLGPQDPTPPNAPAIQERRAA